MFRLMSRSLKALPLAFALAALSIFAASCGSNTPAQVRFVHAIQDAPTLDIDVTGPNVATMPEFTDVSFLDVQPAQPGYTSVPSGSDTIAGVLAGNTSPVFSDTVGWGAGAHYTVVATGFSQTGTNGSNVVLLSIPDNLPTPPSGDVEFRVIHASPSVPKVDVYIELNPNTGPGLPITIQGLGLHAGQQLRNLCLQPQQCHPSPRLYGLRHRIGKYDTNLYCRVPQSIHCRSGSHPCAYGRPNRRYNEFDFPGIVRSQLIANAGFTPHSS